MKKILMIPAVIGLLAVPSFALAHTGTVSNTLLTGASSSDKDTSKNTSKPMSDDNDKSDSSPVVAPAGSISVDQAKTIALGVFPSKTIKSVETEPEHGMFVFSVRFTDGSQVNIQASDGAVLSNESENQSDDSPNAGVNSSKHRGDDNNDN